MVTIYPIKLGERIRNRRKEIGKTLKQVADIVGVTASFLSQVERGKANMSLNSLQQLAGALGVPVLYFLTEDKSPSHEQKNAALQQPEKAGGYGYPPVMRIEERPQFKVPISGVEFELLVHSLTQNMVAYIARLEVGKEHIAHKLGRACEEFRYMLSGVLLVKLDSGEYTLHPGETMYFPNHSFEREKCISQDEEAVWLAVINPPVF